jgi:hypothetical protein
MKEYSVYIQDVFYKNISAVYTSDVIVQINLDIKNNLVPNFDSNKPANVKIIPLS